MRCASLAMKYSTEGRCSASAWASPGSRVRIAWRLGSNRSVVNADNGCQLTSMNPLSDGAGPGREDLSDVASGLALAGADRSGVMCETEAEETAKARRARRA